MLNYIPKFFTSKAIGIYIISLLLVSGFFMGHSMSVLWMLFGVVEAVGFFYFANKLSVDWRALRVEAFKTRLFNTSLSIRLVWVVISYFFYTYMTGQPFEFSAADALMYHDLANAVSEHGYSAISSIFWGMGIDDMGYGIYLGSVYMLTANSILVARLLKAVWGAWTVLLIYKLARRNFGESVGRIAGVMAMLFPNLIYYCGLHLKEVEMVFLTVAFIERADYLLKSRHFNFVNIFWTLVLAGLLFTFRTVLGAAALFALLSALLFSSSRMLKMGNRIVIGVWVLLVLMFFAGGRISRQIEHYWSMRGENQENSMQWRAKREGGNTLAKYASSTIFAPAIFIIPISTMVNIETQQNQQLIHGGNFVKNVLSFFIYFIIIWLIRNKKWRDFVLIEVFFITYLLIVAMSAFAHSERFHQPALPLYILFAAFGISKMSNKTKKYFNWYIIGVCLVVFAWNFVKLSGRGMV